MCNLLSPLTTLTGTAPTTENGNGAPMTTTIKHYSSECPHQHFIRPSSTNPSPWRSVTREPLSHTFLLSAPLIPTNTILTAVFHLPNGAIAAATKFHKLHHKLCEPARTVNIAPSLVGNSFLSTVKMVQAGYTAIYNNNKVIFNDSATAKISISEAAVLTRYVCPWTQLWRVPLVTTVRNENTDTLLLDHPRKHESLNAAHTVKSSSITRAHINNALSVARGRTASTTSTNSPALNQQSDIFMQRRVSPLRNHGSGPYGGATITLGL
jgi:hypothetical protein